MGYGPSLLELRASKAHDPKADVTRDPKSLALLETGIRSLRARLFSSFLTSFCPSQRVYQTSLGCGASKACIPKVNRNDFPSFLPFLFLPSHPSTYADHPLEQHTNRLPVRLRVFFGRTRSLSARRTSGLPSTLDGRVFRMVLLCEGDPGEMG